ncbi:MAG TPA: Ig-like domain-containing protein, partial [Rheinheimera sp.]|uniref:beta strand repeat-containing protein n=1 Tax=Rheinheimera sp. TaxID=1869214 RepID=UPI002B45F749
MKKHYQWIKNGLPLIIALAPGMASASSRNVSSVLKSKKPIVLTSAQVAEQPDAPQDSFSAFSSESTETFPLHTATIAKKAEPALKLQPLQQQYLTQMLNKNSSSGQAGSRFDGVKAVGGVNELIRTVGNCITSITSSPGLCQDDPSVTCSVDADCDLSLSVADAFMAEGNSGSTNMAHTVSLNRTTLDPVTVTYTTSAVSATAGSDYTHVTDIATIAAGQTTTIVNVPILGDGLIETDETYTLTLSDPSIGASISDATATGTITNDDVAPAVTSVTSSSANGTYNTGDIVSVTVNFSKNVTVTGTPQLTLETGTTDTVLNYSSGSTTSALEFNYTVAAGHSSPDLDYISTSALALNSGTIRDAATNNAILTLASPGAANSLGANKNFVIDGIDPTVSSVSVPANATYSSGQNLDFTVNTSENVTINTGGGTPRIALTIGATTRYATYVSGTGTSALLFRYTVDITDVDTDGIAVGAAIDANGGTLRDAATNSLTLTLNSVGATTGVLVVSTPAVTDGNISISGASGTGGAYKIGDTVTASWNNTAGGDNNSGITGVTVDFSAFGGGAAVAATESSGTWTASYTITAGALDAANRNVSVTASNAQGPTTRADTTNATVDSVAPTVSNANISISGATGTGGAYKIGDTVTASWNNTAGGDNNSDTISGATVDFSSFGGGAAVAATNSAGTWTATYTLTAGVIDAANRNVSFSAVDNAGNTTTTADTTNATVDTVGPIVSDVYIGISGGTGTAGAYIIGDTVTASWDNSAIGDDNSDTISATTVDFSAFGGGAAVAATNSSGTWTATYTLTSGAIEATNLNVSVTAMDNAGNTRTQADSSNAAVDNVAPAVASVSVPANATYKAGDNLDFVVSIASASDVVVDSTGGTPRLALTIGSSTVYASYISGSASPNLTFRYTVQAADLDADGIAVAAAIDLNGGTLKDGSGNNLALTLNSVGSTAAVLVDAAPPAAPSTPDLAAGSDTGGSSTDNITSDTTPTLTGTAEANSTVTLYDTDGTTALGTTPADGSGNWSITSSALDDDSHTLRVKATDAAGNESDASTGLSVTIDTAAPTVTDANISIAGGSGTSGAYIVGDTVTASWNNSAGGDNNSDVASTVTIDFSAFGGGAAVAATNSGGTWSATYSIVAGVIDGTNLNVSVSATDTAGNLTTTADSSNATVDTIVATISSVGVPANATYEVGQNLDFTVNANQNITVNTAGGTPRIALTLGASTVYATYVSGSSTGVLTFRYTVQVGDADSDGIAVSSAVDLNGGTLKDAGGNNLTLTLNSVGSTAAVLVDAVAPTAPATPDLAAGSDTGGSSTDNITNDTTPTITGTAEANSSVTLYDTDGTTALGTVAADGSGNWSITSSALSEGTHTLTVKATDAANNTSLASAGLSVTIDTTAPSITGSTPDVAALANAASVIFTVAFNDTVYGLAAGDFTVTATGSALGTAASVSAASGTSVNVTVNTISGAGTLRLDTNASGITDLAGNQAPAFTSGGTHTVDHDAPV